MLRRKIPSLVVDFSATYKGTAAALSSYLFNASEIGDSSEKTKRNETEKNELELNPNQLIVLDESSDEDEYFGMHTIANRRCYQRRSTHHDLASFTLLHH